MTACGPVRPQRWMRIHFSDSAGASSVGSHTLLTSPKYLPFFEGRWTMTMSPDFTSSEVYMIFRAGGARGGFLRPLGSSRSPFWSFDGGLRTGRSDWRALAASYLHLQIGKFLPECLLLSFLKFVTIACDRPSFKVPIR